MTVTFKVSPQKAAELKQAAARKRISTSKYVRDAVESRLQRDKKKSFKSAYDALMEVGAIGCFSSGKHDVATNPKYMKGFGQWKR